MTTRQPTPGLHENFAKEVEAPGTATDTAQLIEALESAGAGMANICFNLSQDAALPASVRQSMKTGQMQWDAALRALRAARAAPTPPPQSHVVPTEANNLIREAITHIQEQRDDLFAGHSIRGKLVVLDATDAIAAQAISDLDNWILRAKAFVAEVSTDA